MNETLTRLLDRAAHALRHLRGDQGGQSLIVVALAMTVALGISAFAIDAGIWYQKHHQAQVAYDAATLAAANCLANAGSGQPCTSSTDVSAAKTIAVTYAQQNGITISPSDVSVDTTKDTVTINAPTGAPSFFANLFGIHSATVRAGATASWKTSGSTPCTATNQSQCSAIYAGNTSCTQGEGLQFGTANQGGASLSVTGMIHTEGEMTFQNATVGASGLTVSGSCYSAGTMPSNDGNTATQVPSESWPIDYRKSPYFTACTTDCKTVSGIANVPSYCTQATTSSSGFTFYQNNGVYVLPQNGNIYCSIGTGNPSDPSTWNGQIDFQTSIPANANSQCKSYTTATYIGGTIISKNPNGGGFQMCLSPASTSNNCLMYSNDTVELYNGQFGWTGDIFAPDGTIQLGTAGSGGGSFKSPSGMLEGLNVFDPNISMTLTGDGPVMTGGGGTSSGTDSLTN